MRHAAVAALLAALTLAPAAGAATWARPVPGAVARPFAYGPDPFARGLHRGVDLAAPVGAAVRAACAGTVVAAGWNVVTVRCGRWRVTHLPLAHVAVRVGARVHAGARIGRLGRAGGHRGLHLGVRRAGDRFGYVDPLRFLPTGGSTPPSPGVPRRGPRVPPVGTTPAAAPLAGASPADAPSVGAPHAPASVGPALPLPAWLGLALLALGGTGGIRLRIRRRRAAAPAARRESRPHSAVL